MAQDDLVVANGSGAAVRADINSQLQALGTGQSGSSAPGTTYAYQVWNDTTTALRKQRNAANSAWIVRGTLAESIVLSRSSNTVLSASNFASTIVATASFTQTFAAASGLGDGWLCYYQVNAGAAVTLDPDGSENIDGGTTKVVTGPASGIIVCNGSAFFTIGFPDVSGRKVLIDTLTPSAVAQQDITGFSDTFYSNYIVEFDKILPATDGATPYLRSSTDGGSNFDAGASDYFWHAHGPNNDFSALVLGGSTGAAQMALTAEGVDNAAAGMDGTIEVLNPGAAAYCTFLGRFIYYGSDGLQTTSDFFGRRLAAANVDALRFLFSSGNITSGTIRLYGITK